MSCGGPADVVPFAGRNRCSLPLMCSLKVSHFPLKPPPSFESDPLALPEPQTGKPVSQDERDGGEVAAAPALWPRGLGRRTNLVPSFNSTLRRPSG